ncbi:hypothetical protein MARA_33490 [Mycolicibacterium arabiense]|uniref:DUF2127 domain-containing protein n=1 Tax=Mycolicibacterium arabiense TaxID=1286181 RepID=A0A7I7S086_9MYCO|nr:DUF2127 domain-containing protein [Mycolicibacterium arabiense]MCV7371190.1 DUF2127 domain-containing protein [Mycolicibacterium arabiense]BBY49881.1 hypothetical protein MARA_33490 [Mycolicibacterium arabiense]
MSTPRSTRRWELLFCAFAGHATFAPDDPTLSDRLHGTTGVGEAWRCLRCGDFALGPALATGPTSAAPKILRGKALRQVVIVRVLAVERLIRALLLALAAWGVWKFRDEQLSLQAVFDRDLPLLRQSGFRVDEMSLVHTVEKALAAPPSTLALLVAALGAYAVLELIEAAGLWLLKRWGEYFAVVATSVFLPLEVYDLANGVTITRVLTFAVNVAAVVYLLVSKRLFGLRGGRAAYEAERRGEQLLDLERAAATRPT